MIVAVDNNYLMGSDLGGLPWSGIERDKIEKILLDLNLDLNLRPGNLTLKNWEQIHKSINNEN